MAVFCKPFTTATIRFSPEEQADEAISSCCRNCWRLWSRMGEPTHHNFHQARFGLLAD
jgi:hypothetical protein